jgi:hypothetical protein
VELEPIGLKPPAPVSLPELSLSELLAALEGPALHRDVVPRQLLARTIRAVLPKRRHVGKLVLAMPMIFLAMLSWALGELVGYSSGTGGSCKQPLLANAVGALRRAILRSRERATSWKKTVTRFIKAAKSPVLRTELDTMSSRSLNAQVVVGLLGLTADPDMLRGSRSG